MVIILVLFYFCQFKQEHLGIFSFSKKKKAGGDELSVEFIETKHTTIVFFFFTEP